MDPENPTNPDHTDAEADAAADPVQSAVRTLLRTAPDPGPMPADVTRRIEDSLGQAAVRRTGDHELFDELGFGDPDAVLRLAEILGYLLDHVFVDRFSVEPGAT